MRRLRRRSDIVPVEPKHGAWLASHLPAAAGVLRPGPWRPLRSLAWLITLLVVSMLLLSVQSIVRSFYPNEGLSLGIAFLTVVLVYACYAILVRKFERRPVEELAIEHLPKELLGGVVLGVLLMSAVIGLLWLSGFSELEWGRWSDWPHDTREALGTGLLEELLARLVIFRMLACAFRVKPALVLSALIFGGAHLANPNATLISSIAIAVEAGLLLAGFYLLTGRIWLSVGVHAGWNFSQGGIFGTPVSGMPSDGSLFQSMPAQDVPNWITGGAFGPEGSVIAVLAGSAAFIVTMVVLRRQTPVHAD